jgi:hypothetical protein
MVEHPLDTTLSLGFVALAEIGGVGRVDVKVGRRATRKLIGIDRIHSLLQSVNSIRYICLNRRCLDNDCLPIVAASKLVEDGGELRHGGSE